jgi:hypothetical protein
LVELAKIVDVAGIGWKLDMVLSLSARDRIHIVFSKKERRNNISNGVVGKKSSINVD